jgi:hypothetical protein
MYQRVPIACVAVILSGCGGNAPEAARPESADMPSVRVSTEQYRKEQERRADSVLTQLKTADQVAKSLGRGYMAGSERLRDSVTALATRTSCFEDARQTDPYLAGTVSFLVVVTESGPDVAQVQENATVWTSTAGNIVNSCLNVAAKDWRFDGRFGKAGNYITQVQFK